MTNSNFSSSSIQANPVWSPVAGQTYTGVTDLATDAFDRVLDYMGANWWTRDEVIDTVDERIIHEVRTGTGKIMAWADDPFNDYETPPPGYDPYDPDEGAEWRSLLALRADTVTGAAPFNRDANWDTDLDGMPDTWELEHGLDPSGHDHNGDVLGARCCGYLLRRMDATCCEASSRPGTQPPIDCQTNGQ